MKPPCELVVGKLLPSIRSAIVKVLIEDYHMKQQEISNILGISQSAVSQYYTSTRAADKGILKTFPEITKYAKEITKKLVSGELESEQILLCEPCQKIRQNQKFTKTLEEFFQLKKCKICPVVSDD